MDDRKEDWRVFSRIGAGYGAFLAVTFLLQLQLGLITGVLLNFGIDIAHEVWYMPLVSFASYGFGGGITYLIVKDMPVLFKPEKRKAGAGFLAVGFLICISALFIGNLMGLGLMSMVSFVSGKPMVNPIAEMLKNLSGWSIFLTMVILAPVCEEILYRKVLIDRIRQYGDRAAILVSGLVFALSHGNFYQFFYALGIGLVFGYVYIQTGKIRYTIGFHMAINFFGSIVALYASNNQWVSAAYSMFLMGGAFLGLVLFGAVRKRLHLEPGMAKIQGKGLFCAAFFNLGMILFVLASAATFVISEIS